MNYLNNKDLLEEIFKSKNSYCYYEKPEYSFYDIIVNSTDECFDENIIQQAKENKVKRLANLEIKNAAAQGIKKKMSEVLQDPSTVKTEELIFRVMSFDHIPKDENRKKTKKTVADSHVKLNFPPFIHVMVDRTEDIKGIINIVGKSHTKDGKFSSDHGTITRKLADMFLLLVERYAQRPNWRGYTYLDEMKGQAMIQLSQYSLMFNEQKSDNPFSYLTVLLENSFTRIVKIEKQNQELRDQMLIEMGFAPSFSKQMAHEEEIRKARDKDRE